MLAREGLPRSEEVGPDEVTIMKVAVLPLPAGQVLPAAMT